MICLSKTLARKMSLENLRGEVSMEGLMRSRKGENQDNDSPIPLETCVRVTGGENMGKQMQHES